MATANEYATWIVKNQSKRGTPEFATVSAAYEEAKREEETPASAPKESGIVDKLKGAGEAALTSVTALPAMAVGGLNALNAIGGNVAKFATGRTDYQDVAQAFEQPVAAMTYAPKTEEGQAILQGLATATAPLPGLGGEMAAISRAAQLAKPATQVAAQSVRPAVTQAVQQVKPAVVQAVESVRSKMPGAPQAFGKGTAGAAETPQALQRRETAAQLPVPFEGRSALTRGQATRDFEQLQFEKETAKRADIGAPLRARAENQSETLIQNLDSLIERAAPISIDPRTIGKDVDRALVNKANYAQRRITSAYTKAREAGQMAEPIEMTPLAEKLNDLTRFEGVSGNISAVKKEAQRLGAVLPDENGALIPKKLTIDDSELLRQFVNDATDWSDKRQARAAKIINGSIDAATENKGGDLYKAARKLRTDYAREFENVGITSKLLGTKRGTDERQIAFDDVFRKVVLDSPIEEMNKLRRTLIGAGDEGKQAWTDMKAQGIEHIKQEATRGSGMDSRGNPLVSVAGLKNVVQSLDKEGKLESLYGKKQAQVLRDLSELAQVIYTAPPGAVNISNTASALLVALDSLATFVITGIPAPAASAIKEASRYMKNRKIAQRINDALGQQGGKQ